MYADSKAPSNGTNATVHGPSKLREFLPYILGTVLSCMLVIFILCVLCSKWCRVCLCRSMFCCCIVEPIIEDFKDDQSDNSQLGHESSASASRVPITSAAPNLPPSQAPSISTVPQPTALHAIPNTQTSSVPPPPSKQNIIATVRTQRHIGNILSTQRRSSMVSTYPSPPTAPPAVKQVARTVKIIGNILTVDGAKRRKG